MWVAQAVLKDGSKKRKESFRREELDTWLWEFEHRDLLEEGSITWDNSNLSSRGET